jgi:hypothetical protein
MAFRITLNNPEILSASIAGLYMPANEGRKGLFAAEVEEDDADEEEGADEKDDGGEEGGGRGSRGEGGRRSRGIVNCEL